MTERPSAPPSMRYPALRNLCAVVPAPELEAWARRAFVDEDGPLANADHAHLRGADVRFLWTDADNRRRGRFVAATAELGEPAPSLHGWTRARIVSQMLGWWGCVPDFVVTVSAPAWYEMDDTAACSLVEHELYHCAQASDEFGAPRFRKDGRPVWSMRGHDVEEFAGVVERYGAHREDVRRFVGAALLGPTVAPASIAAACGTCLAR